MKKISKLFLSALLCLSIALTAITPAFAAAARVKKFKATATYNSVTLTWQKMNGVSGYEVQQYVNKKWTKLKIVKNPKYTAKNLKTGVRYTFRVAALKKSGGKVFSDKLTVRTACAAPRNFRFTVLSPTSARLAWKKVGGATSYRIQKWNGKKWVKVADVNKITYTVTSLTPNVAAKFRVCALRKVGKRNVIGTYTGALQVKTSIPTPAASFKSAAVNSVSIGWSKVNGATDYVVYKVNGTKYTQVAVSKATSATINGLAANTVYRFAVRARVGSALSGYSSAVNTKTAPATVSGLTASAEASGSVTLRWKDAQNAEKYEIYQLKNGKFVLAGTAKKGASSFTVTGLEELAEYTFKVKAVGLYAGKTLPGAFSGEVKATTMLSSVKNLKFDSSTENSVTVSWTPHKNGVSYTVEYSENGKDWKSFSVAQAEGERLTAKIEGLSPATAYKVRVTTIAAEQKSTPSSAINTKTVPQAVTGITAEAGDEGRSLTLKWNPSAKADGYIIINNVSGVKVESTSPSYTFRGLIKNYEYSFTVKAYSKLDSSKLESKETASGTFKTKMGNVENFRFTEVTERDASTGKIKVSTLLVWNSIPNAEYVIEKKDSSNSWKSFGKTAETKYTISSQINNLKQTKKSDYVTTISWDAVPGANKYIIKTNVSPNQGSLTTLINQAETTGTSIDLRLAPATEVEVVVLAVGSLSAFSIKAVDTDKVNPDTAYVALNVGSATMASSTIKFKTPNAPAFSDKNSESRELYTLKLLQAINNTKFEMNPVTVRLVSKVDAKIGKITLRYVNLLGKEVEKSFDNIDLLMDFVRLFDPSINLEDDLTDSIGENKDVTVKFTNGSGSYQVKDPSSGQVLTYHAALSSFVSPSSHPAYLYNQHNNAAFANGVSAVSVSKSGSTDKITVSLKAETQNASNTAKYHPGFLNSLTEKIDSISDTSSGTSASVTVGPSKISGSVNSAGTLDSLNVSSKFSITVGAKIGDSDTIKAVSFIVEGTATDSYTFTR